MDSNCRWLRPWCKPRTSKHTSKFTKPDREAYREHLERHIWRDTGQLTPQYGAAVAAERAKWLKSTDRTRCIKQWEYWKVNMSALICDCILRGIYQKEEEEESCSASAVCLFSVQAGCTLLRWNIRHDSCSGFLKAGESWLKAHPLCTHFVNILSCSLGSRCLASQLFPCRTLYTCFLFVFAGIGTDRAVQCYLAPIYEASLEDRIFIT